MKLKLTSTAFKDGEPIPKKFSGEGEDISPAFAWDGVPESTQEFALICDDPDARSKNPWVHWVIYGIGPDVRALPENLQPGVGEITEPLVARQGENFFDEGHIFGWRGPMPPVGRGVHHYNFKLYALDKRLDLPPKATKPQLLEAMQGHILAEAVLIGTYERKH
jgi:Raf kinase inhibitor-like YbhB/YbcL family protein